MEENIDKEELINKIIETKAVVKQAKWQYYLTHFYEFNRDILAWPDIYEPLHKVVCDFVQKNIEKKKLLILLPRNTFKSSLITVGFTLWRIAQNLNERILIANATYPMACQFLSQIKNHLTKNEKFVDLVGDLAASADSWREDKIMVSTEKSYEQKEPTVSAFGMGSNLVGSHYSLAILDDMVNRENIGTREQIDKVINFYKDSLDLVDPISGKKQIIVVGTSWHQSDLYSWIQDPENNFMSDFETLIMPAYEGEWGTGKLLFPTRLSWEVLEELKRQQGISHFCTPAESPVIMGDLSVKPISKIKKGDEVVGWEDKKRPKRILKRTKVKNIYQYEADIVEMKTDKGRIVRCTQEHKWYTARSDKTHRLYKPAKIGSKLIYIFNPIIPILNSEQQQLAYWLGGFFDGEGCCSGGYNSINFAQSKYANPLIWEKMQTVCSKLGFKYNIWEKLYNPENPRSRGGYKGMLWLNGGKQGKMDFLNLCKPFKKEKILRTVFNKAAFIQSRDKVINIKPIGKKRVYALETETGNYIVWGYGSSNSAQYLLDPVPLEDAVFKFDYRYYEETDIKGLPLNRFVCVDPAISEKKEADYTALVCVGVDKNNDWYVLDLFRGHIQPSELINLLFAWDTRWKPVTVGIELTAFQKVLQFMLFDEMKKRNHFIPITELKHTDVTKDQRIRGLEPHYQSGSLFHNKQLSFNDVYEDELRRFPRGKNDDMIDAMSSISEIAYPAKMKEKRERQTHYGYRMYPA